MLIQVCKLCGCHPIVAVVGSSHKVALCHTLGADIVIDKSTEGLWAAAEESSPDGYIAVFDANGVATLQASYDHLAMCGRLIVYGFHTNLPMGSSMLSPWAWIKMAFGMAKMPKFDSMGMVMDSKAVMGFNLSFFAEEREIIGTYLDQIGTWLEAGQLRVAQVTEYEMEQVAEAHALIQSGRSVGKIVCRTGMVL